MSQLLSTPSDCCKPCPSPLVENIPGVQGPPGDDGTNGTNGVNAYTLLTASFVMPAEAANVTVAVLDGSWCVVGENVVVGKFGDAAFGTFQVVQVVSSVSVILKNIEDTGTGAYASNSPPATVFPSGATVGPSGIQGVTGSAPAGVFLVANNLSEGVLATKQANLGIGTAGTRADGYFFQVANNLSEGTPATMRTNLGLGTAAVKDSGVTNTKLPPIDTTFTNGDAVFATATGLQTKTAANARLALGIGGGLVGNYVLVQTLHASNTVADAFNNGADVTVPLNTLVSDSGSIASFNAGTNTLTLPAGTYRVRASVMGYQVGLFQAWLYDSTHNTVIARGSVASSDVLTANVGISLISGRFTIAGATTFILQAHGTSAGSFGPQCALGQEVYASLELEQES